MKAFKVPEVEFVYFGQKDIISTSTPCVCVDCTVCDYGNDCRKYDFGKSYDACKSFDE